MVPTSTAGASLLAAAVAAAAAASGPGSAAAASLPALSTLLLRRRRFASSPPPASSSSSSGAPQPPPIVPRYPPAPGPTTPIHATVNGRRVTFQPPNSSSNNNNSSDNKSNNNNTKNTTITNWPPSVLDAAAAAGASVPTLCKPPKIPSRNPGTCRVCLVEVDGALKPACCTPLRDGAVVRTDTEEVERSVRGTLALLRQNHPEACMTCSADGRCEFQDLVSRYSVPLLPKVAHLANRPAHRNAGGNSGGGNGGDTHDHRATVGPAGPGAAVGVDSWLPYDASSTAIALDADKCIQCGRCVDVCAEQQGMDVLAFYGRGRDRHLGFAASDAAHSHCIGCGQCVASCPVGALSERTEWREVMALLQQRRAPKGREVDKDKGKKKESAAASPSPSSPAPSSSSSSSQQQRGFSSFSFAAAASAAADADPSSSPAAPKDRPRPRRAVMVAQTAPSVRVALAEEVGLAPGTVTSGQLVAALRELGFHYVFDTDFAADLTIVEEGHELIGRLAEAWAREALGNDEAGGGAAAGGGGGHGHGSSDGSSRGHGSSSSGSAHSGGPNPPAVAPLPMFTSCCPAWVHLVESDYPSLVPHLSSCKSPQGMLAAVIKRVWWPRRQRLRAQERARRRQEREQARARGSAGAHLASSSSSSPLGHADDDGDNDEEEEQCVHVSIMPCVAKKAEAARPQLGGDVDYVLTTRELGRALRAQRVPVASLAADGPGSRYDDPLGLGTGAGVLFGAAGGVMEAALRTVYEVATGGKVLGPLAFRPVEDAFAAAPPRSPYNSATSSGHSQGGGALMEAALTLPVAPILRLGLGEAGKERAERAIAALGGEGAAREARVVVASGVAAARRLLDADADARARGDPSPPLSRYLFAEVMACVSGCVNGGGQPKAPPARPGHPETAWASVVAARTEAIRALDRAAPLRRSHLNPDVRALYGLDGGGGGAGGGEGDVLALRGGVGGAQAHELLHTAYGEVGNGGEGGRGALSSSSSLSSPPYASEQRAAATAAARAAAASARDGK